jgi:hypothetical protein
MNSFLKTAATAAFAVAIGFGIRTSHAATVIDSGDTATVDGWQVSAGNGIGLVVRQQGSDLVVEKTANFPTLSSALVTFNEVSGSAPTTIVFEGESITNSGSQAWSGFQFLLANDSVGPSATFAGLSESFVPPIGTGVDYTGASIDGAKDTITYTGVQGAGTISNWGGTSASDKLVIDTNGDTNFAFDEIPLGGPAVPLPAAAWQGLVGLLGLGAIASVKKIKNQLSA